MKNNLTGKRKLSHSQNFLKNPEFVKGLIDKTGIDANDLVVEIGSGRGIITELLANKARRVIGVELDDRLFADLRKRFQKYPNVEIIRADFLKWELPPEPYKVFSNIPFNMTTDIVIKLLSAGNPPTVAYLVMQDKAAERFIGDPLSKNTQMSILLKPYFEMAIVARIDKKQFVPVPQVDAVLVMFKRREMPLVEPQLTQLFRDFVVYGYNQWKPTVLEAFEKIFSHKQRVILEKKADIRGATPRDLNLGQWLVLFAAFVDYVSGDKKAAVEGAEERLKKQQEQLQKQFRTRWYNLWYNIH